MFLHRSTLQHLPFLVMLTKFINYSLKDCSASYKIKFLSFRILILNIIYYNFTQHLL